MCCIVSKRRPKRPANRSVFHDLGFDEAEARVLAMRADLMAGLASTSRKPLGGISDRGAGYCHQIQQAC
jgi:hypothetical protein